LGAAKEVEVNDNIVPLNYSAHAIEAFKPAIQALRGNGLVQSADMLEFVCELLQRSVKFILPNMGQLIAPGELAEKHFDLAHLPFPIVAFEYPAHEEDPLEFVGEFKQYGAPKRIALCFELTPEFFRRFPDQVSNPHAASLGAKVDQLEPGVCVISVYYTEELQDWQCLFGAAFVPHGATRDLPDPTQTAESFKQADDALISAGLVSKKRLAYRMTPFVLLPEIYASEVQKIGKANVDTTILLDIRDEVQAYVQACAVLNCANVSLADVADSPALNKKRLAKGQQPFFSYKVLQLTDDTSRTRAPARGGTHASPRQHLRRGHIRRLENRTVFVRPAMVNVGSARGKVQKDYSLDRSKE
jgi:hypothetical protein